MSLAADYHCGDGLLMKNGQLYNNLVAQALALGLNLRLDPTLGGVAFESRCFHTVASSDCDEGGVPIGDWTNYSLPYSIYYFAGWDKTVEGLMEIANSAIEGESGMPPLPEITYALGMVNEAFDECAFLEFTSCSIQPTYDPPKDDYDFSTGIYMDVYPNPFATNTNIQVEVTVSTDATLEVYSLLGVKVATLFEGHMEAGRIYSYSFEGLLHMAQETYICVLRTENATKYEKVMKLQ